MRRLLISAAMTLACITATAAAEDNNAAQGVGDTTETGTNPSGVDPITGKPPGVADATYIAVLSHGAKAGAEAGGVAGTLTNQPIDPSVAVKR